MAAQATRIRLFLVDDHLMFLQGVKGTISPRKGIQVVGEAMDGETAIRKAKALRPDVILLDLSLPDISGMDVFRELHPGLPKTKFIILTVHGNLEYRSFFKNAGAHGYITKNLEPALLEGVIRKVHAGDRYFPDITPEKPITIPFIPPDSKNEGNAEEDGGPDFGLTRMESQIADLLAKGLAADTIGLKLNISRHTVNTHLKHIYRKLGVKNKGEAMAKLLRLAPPVT